MDFTNNQYIGELPKKGYFEQFLGSRKDLAKKKGIVFLTGGGWLITQCTL